LVAVELGSRGHTACIVGDNAADCGYTAAGGIGTKYAVIRQQSAIGHADDRTGFDLCVVPIFQYLNAVETIAHVNEDVVAPRLAIQA